ncbi:MAG: cellulase family glycosylhydrolase [Candidatus Bathyarchaeota archaeon]|nr:cellulase family glycosylhydrolase [Candidatus Bathyarchaeota archaeon]
MKIGNIGDTLHSINLRKRAKPLALCITALFIISTLTALSSSTVQASVTPALHTSGRSIVDQNGNTVYLRGMGLAGMAPNLLLWGPSGTDNWGVQWNPDPAIMDQTFASLQSDWHVNMIRVFVLPSWYYRDNIVPAQEDPNAYSQTAISTRAYLRTLCQEADKYGIYVDIVPYMLTPPVSSFSNDLYATSNFGWQGLPMMGWDESGNRFLSDAGYAGNEQGFWNWFWTDMANNLKNCPNAIFEAWNEPGWGGGDVEPIPAGYMTYLQTMYNAIRGTGSNNLVMIQWRMGWNPNNYGGTLAWTSDVNNALNPTNVVYTTHFYYYAPADLTGYWATDYNTLKTQVQTAIDSMGIVAPLVINEEGSCTIRSVNRANDCTWWQNLLMVQRDLGIGAGAYYWLSDSGLGGIYAGEALLSSGYLPNDMGQIYINTYVPTPETTATATSTPEATSTATTTTATTTVAPTDTPTATPQPTIAPTATPTEQPTTPEPTENAPYQQLVHHCFSQWRLMLWSPLDLWFSQL